jgi:hypothetical protein
MVGAGTSQGNPLWLVVVAPVVGLVLMAVVRQKRQQKHRDRVAAAYARQAVRVAVPAHSWQPAATEPLVMVDAPDPNLLQQLPTALRWMVKHQSYPTNAVSTACSTTIDGVSVTAFDNVQTRRSEVQNPHSSNTVVERTLCIRFAAGIALPTIRLCANSNYVHGMVSPCKTVQWQSVRPELDDFNECYGVASTDVKAAFAFFEPPMMMWLLAQTRLVELNIEGTDVFAAFAAEDHAAFDPDAALPFVVRFLSQIKTLSLI